MSDQPGTQPDWEEVHDWIWEIIDSHRSAGDYHTAYKKEWTTPLSVANRRKIVQWCESHDLSHVAMLYKVIKEIEVAEIEGNLEYIDPTDIEEMSFVFDGLFHKDTALKQAWYRVLANMVYALFNKKKRAWLKQ